MGLLPAPETKPEVEDDVLEEWEASMDMRRKDFKRREDALKGPGQLSPTGTSNAPRKAKFGDSSDDDDDATVDNPLSNAPGSVYSQNYERSKLEATVEKDMGRLWSDDPFFEQEFVLSSIRRVLMLYCEEERELGYRQGMHELASFIVYILHQDADSVLSMRCGSDEAHVKETVEYVCSSSFLVPDAYWIFRRLMDTPGLHLAQWYYVPESTLRPGGEESEITFVANLVQNGLLRNVDSKLAVHLNDTLNIHATSYGIRWLRLLFLREFSFSHCARIWDCMFADYAWTSLLKANRAEYNVSQSVLPHIAVSMLLFVREELLQSDFSFALRRLMRYPPVEDVNGFISNSVRRKYNGNGLASLLEGYNSVLSQPEKRAPVGASSASVVQPQPLPVTAGSRQKELGESLAGVVSAMERQWFPQPQQTDEERERAEEQYLVAIAELKRVRDVLLGLVAE